METPRAHTRALRPRRTLRVAVLLTTFSAQVALSPPAGAIPTSFAALLVHDGASANAITTGDIDGDGDLDLASASGADDTITWYENTTGGGTAWPALDVATDADGANSVEVGDLDGDGDLDLISTSSADNTVAWYENTAGDGSAWTPTNISTTIASAKGLAVGDVDGDGDLDLATSSFTSNTVTWFENFNNAASWGGGSVSAVSQGPTSVAMGDLDGDGDLDLISSSQNDDLIAWYKNDNGDGSVWVTQIGVTHVADGAQSVIAEDLDGDGDVDLASASSLDDTIAWYENTAGNGTAWTAMDISTVADHALSVRAADLDADGDLDLVSASQTDNTIAWYENQAGDGSDWEATDVATAVDAAQFVTTGDVDGDGDDDIASAGAQDDSVWLFRNSLPARSFPSWSENEVGDDSDGPQGLASADIDGDGDIDFATGSFFQDDVGWYENTAGDGSAWTTRVVSLNTADGPQSYAAADIDGDGDMDLATAGFFDDTIAWYENTAGDGSAWTAMDVAATADGAYYVIAADLDSDGDLDLASASSSDHTIAWYENTAGDGSAWTPTDISTTAGGATSVATGDIDRDGDLDLASAGQGDDDVTWYENTAGDATAWTPFDVDTSNNLVNTVALGDLDGDGDLDLMAGGQDTPRLTWYENLLGDGSDWAAAAITESAMYPLEVQAADLDGDGDLDVASTDIDGSKISWHENTAGDASTWSDHVIGQGLNTPFALEPADVNGDGEIDVAAASSTDDTVTWYEVLPSLSISDGEGDEGNAVELVVSAGRTHEAVDVNVSTAAVTAAASTDYTELVNQPVAILAGQVSQTVQVQTIEDDIDEPDETFTATLSSPQDAGITDGQATGTIDDDDPVPSLTVAKVKVTEKDTTTVEAELTLNLSNPSSTDYVVRAKTKNDTAKSGKDYETKDKEITSSPGTTSKTFTVKVKGDKIDEPEEKLLVEVSKLSGAFLDDAKVTITDDDPLPKLSVTNVSKNEGDSGKKSYTFKVKLNRESGKTVTVKWETVSKGARSPSDFVAKDGKLTFKPGKTKKEVVVKVKGDRDDEGKEEFRVKIRKPVKAEISDAKGKGTIKNDD